METQIARTISSTVRCLVVLLLLSVAGCGGGTTGSGGTGASDFRGRVAVGGTTPVEGLTITIPETGDSAITGSEGTFEFTTQFSGEEVNLLLEKSGLSGSINLGKVPADSVVEIDVWIEFQGNTIIITINKLTITPKS